MGRLLLIVLVCFSLAAQEAVSFQDGPWDRPELDSLLDARSFYVSFDHGFVPDLAAGETWAPRLEGPYDKTRTEPARVPGFSGEGLQLSSGAATYPVPGNFPVTSRGAVALWVKPMGWQRPNGNNVTFVVLHGGGFYLQRQGPMVREDGQITRQEHIQFLAKASRDQRRYTSLGGGRWENGEWYLLVANWSWPTMQLSVNGQDFSVKSLPNRPADDVFGNWFKVGSCGADGGVLDELMIFDRPLEIEEVRLLHAAGRAAIDGLADEQRQQAMAAEPDLHKRSAIQVRQKPMFRDDSHPLVFKGVRLLQMYFGRITGKLTSRWLNQDSFSRYDWDNK